MHFVNNVLRERRIFTSALTEQVYAALVKNAFAKDKFPFWKTIFKVLFNDYITIV